MEQQITEKTDKNIRFMALIQEYVTITSYWQEYANMLNSGKIVECREKFVHHTQYMFEISVRYELWSAIENS